MNQPKNVANRRSTESILWKRDRWILMFLGDCTSTHEQTSWASGHYQVERRIHWQNDFQEQDFLKIISYSGGWTKFIVFLVKFILKNTSFVHICDSLFIRNHVALGTVHHCLFLRTHHSWIHGEIFEIYNPEMKDAICFLSTLPSIGE